MSCKNCNNDYKEEEKEKVCKEKEIKDYKLTKTGLNRRYIFWLLLLSFLTLPVIFSKYNITDEVVKYTLFIHAILLISILFFKSGDSIIELIKALRENK